MTALAQPALSLRATRHPLSRWLGMACLSTVIVLAGLMAKSVAPKAIGVPFVKSR